MMIFVDDEILARLQKQGLCDAAYFILNIYI